MLVRSPPVRYHYRGNGPYREVVEEQAVRETCVCGREYWRWPGSKAEHCAYCLTAHPEWRPQKGISREH